MSLNRLFSSENSFGKRGVVLNLRNIGFRSYLFGLSYGELIGGIGGSLLLSILYGVRGILFLGAVWAVFVGIRALKKRKFFAKKSQKFLVPKSPIRFYSESRLYFGDYFFDEKEGRG